MKLAIALTVVLATCHANDFTFPDQLPEIENTQRYKFPAIQPTVQKVNEVEGLAYSINPQASPSQAPSQLGSSPLNRPLSAKPAPPAAANQFMNFLPERWSNHVINIISRGITKFTLDMDRAIRNTTAANTDNLLFSPVSLTLTLAMVLLASGGKTFDEVSKILGLESGVDISHHSEVVHQIFGLMLQEAERYQQYNPTSPKTHVAFGIFVEDGYPVREEFKAVSEKVYQSQIISVDFSHNGKEAKNTINQWVSNKTMGKITNMLQDVPSPLTDVIITSALYFSGEWEQHFIDGATKRKPFNVEADEAVYVDMMFNGGNFPFLEDRELGLKIIGFPYKANQITMYAVLPTRGAGTAAVTELKSRLAPEVIENLLDNMRNSSCIIGYPKMKLSSTLKLQSALEALGLTSLFDPNTADLSLLSPGRGAKQASAVPPSQTTARRAPTTGGFTGGFQPVAQNFDEPSFAFPSRFGDISDDLSRNNLYRRRMKRQSRPINREFLDFLNSQQLPNFGVDELRNKAGLSNPHLFADDVIHKVEMTVNERGTEAAAATAVILDRSGDYKRFIANRPFLFFIRHDASKAIWFWGTINRPTPFYTTP